MDEVKVVIFARLALLKLEPLLSNLMSVHART